MNIRLIIDGVRKYLLGSICAAFALLLLAALLVRRGDLANSQSLIEVKSLESKALKANVVNSSMLLEHLEKLRGINLLVNGRLMRGGELAKNQQYFYKMEADSGVKLMDLRPAAAQQSLAKNTAKSQYSTVSYSCTVQGTYEQLLAFLARLEGGDHFARILTASVSVMGQGGEAVSSPDPALTLVLSIEFLGQS